MYARAEPHGGRLGPFTEASITVRRRGCAGEQNTSGDRENVGVFQLGSAYLGATRVLLAVAAPELCRSAACVGQHG